MKLLLLVPIILLSACTSHSIVHYHEIDISGNEVESQEYVSSFSELGIFNPTLTCAKNFASKYEQCFQGPAIGIDAIKSAASDMAIVYGLGNLSGAFNLKFH